MSGVVIGLVGLLLLVVVGAVIYFAMQEETTPATSPEVFEPAPVVVREEEEEEEEEEDEDTFDIVNGWLYDNEYNYMLGVAKDDNNFKFEKFDSENLNQGFKWTFEKDNSSMKIVNADGKYLKITRGDIQVTTSGSSSSTKVKLVPVDDGYKISNRTGKYWMKMDGASLQVVKDESKASVFSIEPSQYYIKSYETDSKSLGTDFRESMSKHSVSCTNGVISGMKFGADGSKYKYDYKCTEGEAASGDLFSDVSNEAGTLAQIKDLTGSAFNVACEDGALSNFRIVKGTGDTAYYKYACRDVGVSSDTETVTGTEDFVDLTMDEGEGPMDVITRLGGLQCSDGKVLTGFNVTEEDGDKGNYKLSGICKKLAI